VTEPSSTAVRAPDDVLAFWREAGPERWFERDDAFDAAIRARFLATYAAGAAGQLSSWESSPAGALALLLVLDQFPRNMFRDDARAYAADPAARAIADRALARGFDQQVDAGERAFFYLPFEHSEEMVDQARCVALHRALGDADWLKWAELHADIIARFGRFPHRNAVLDRATTPDEQAFLDGGGFKG
jgi:uncharacterized protein (DUF924 family)